MAANVDPSKSTTAPASALSVASLAAQLPVVNVFKTSDGMRIKWD